LDRATKVTMNLWLISTTTTKTTKLMAMRQ